MAAYPAEVETPAPTEHPAHPAQPAVAVPRQRGAALGLAAMAVGASSVIGLAGSALAAEPAASHGQGGTTGSLFVDEHGADAAAAHGSDAGTALLDRIRTQGTPEQAAATTQAQSVRLEAAAAASAKAAAAERVRAVGALVPPVACASTGLARGLDASYWSHLHPGQDFPAPAGTPVRAVGAGIVTDAGWAGSYGYRVVQTLPDGTEIWYCHLSAIATGHGSVPAGHPLGRVGSSRGFTTPHVYIEVRPDGAEPVDPTAWFAAHGLNV